MARSQLIICWLANYRDFAKPFVPSKGGEQPSSPPADCFETPSFVLSLNTQANILPAGGCGTVWG
jgi:hypothetical protein